MSNSESESVVERMGVERFSFLVAFTATVVALAIVAWTFWGDVFMVGVGTFVMAVAGVASYYAMTRSLREQLDAA